MEGNSKLMLLNFILRLLNEGLASTLKYIMFDDDPVYEILMKPYRRVQMRGLMGYLTNTVLLGERMFSWMEKA